MNFSPVSRKNVYLTLTARLASGQLTSIAGASVAVVPPREAPSSSTTWVDAVWNSPVARILVAGPQADPTGALVLPSGGGDLWVRITDATEVDAVFAVRINLR